MGALTLPSSGSVYLYTSVVIYSVETLPPYWPWLQPLWDAGRAGTIELVTSELTLMDTLVVPIRANDQALIAAYEGILTGGGVRLLPITQAILREAARLRAALPALRTPDALHAATARAAGAARVLSNDPGYRRVPGLPLDVLDDVLAS